MAAALGSIGPVGRGAGWCVARVAGGAVGRLAVGGGVARPGGLGAGGVGEGEGLAGWMGVAAGDRLGDGETGCPPGLADGPATAGDAGAAGRAARCAPLAPLRAQAPAAQATAAVATAAVTIRLRLLPTCPAARSSSTTPAPVGVAHRARLCRGPEWILASTSVGRDHEEAHPRGR